MSGALGGRLFVRAVGLLGLAAAAIGALSLSGQAAVDPQPVFVDVTEAAGLRWGIRQLALRGWNVVETMGGGGGFVEGQGKAF